MYKDIYDFSNLLAAYKKARLGKLETQFQISLRLIW